MKKKNTPKSGNDGQLSLFDTFTTHGNFGGVDDGTTGFGIQLLDEELKKYENENNNNQRGKSDAGQQPRSDVHDGFGEPQSDGVISVDKGNEAGTVQQNEIGGDFDTIPERDSITILRPSETIDGSELDITTSGGNGLGRNNQKGGSLDYSNDKQFYDFSGFSKQRHYQDNISALLLLKQLEAEKRLATKPEQTVLAKYAGWGGLKEIVLDPNNENDWKTQSDVYLKEQVKNVNEAIGQLDQDGRLGYLNAAKRSILSAYYTPYSVINSIYKGIEKAGFKGGRILEPSAGIGNFLAAMPEGIKSQSNITAIEMDGLTGNILKKLFPTADTKIAPFEKTNLREGSFDLIISNIPFADVAVYDAQIENQKDKRFSKASGNLHNYFFAKSIMLAKPGAMIALMTSHYTMDSSHSPEVRELMKDTCEFLGAVRLPDNTFKGNAGTEVVSDIIFLRKAEIGETINQKYQFQNIDSVQFTDDKNVSGTISYNEYFFANPAHMLGKVEFGGLYNKEGFNLKPHDGEDISTQLDAFFDKIFETPILKNQVQQPINATSNETVVGNYINLGIYDSIGNIVSLKDGSFGMITGENYTPPDLELMAKDAGVNIRSLQEGTTDSFSEKWLNENQVTLSDFQMKVVRPIKVNRSDAPKLPLIEKLRNLTKEVIYKEVGGWTGLNLENKREELKNTYFKFVSKHGNLTSKENEKLLNLDTDGFLIQSLERKDNHEKKIYPSDILFKQTINPPKEVIHTDSVKDAVMISLQKSGRLKMDFVCDLMGKSRDEIMATQLGDKTEIFFSNDSYYSRDEFLSGNVVEKLSKEEKQYQNGFDNGEAPQNLSLYENNISELKKVLPKPIIATDIYSPLHARWLPKDDIKEFLKDTLHSDSFDLSYSRSMDEYKLDLNASNAHIESFKTQKRSPSWVIQHALNGVEPIVSSVVEGKTVFFPDDTQLAKEKCKEIKQAWDDWKFKDFDRSERLAGIYNTMYNNNVLRKYETKDISFPGLIGYIPTKHQKEAIYRNVQNMGGINDHIVGAGKTLVEIGTAMELKRLGFANKPAIIGLKSQVPQLYEQFKKAYPLSKVLFPTEKDFSKENRQRLLNNIATNNWDCVILSHDQFNSIPQPVEIQVKLMEELADVMRSELDSPDMDKAAKKAMETRLYNYQQKLDKLIDSKKDDNVLDFSKLGLDYLIVDESQEYKNLEFTTRKRNIRGLGNPVGSKKAFNLLIATRQLQDMHKGDKGVLFSSGTPISNSIAELYLLFKYLRPTKLKETGMETFDRWAGNFANDFSDMEFYMGKFKEVHRFREFENVPELINMYQELADVKNDSNIMLDKPKAIHQLIKIQPSENQLKRIEMLQAFIETKGVKNAEILGLTAGYDSKKGVNPSYALLATTYAKKLSIDPRLVNPSEEPGTKITAVADSIAKIFFETEDFKGTQLMFCDIGTPFSSNELDNFHSYLEDEIPQAELIEIFGGDYNEMEKKPKLEDIKEKASDVLRVPRQEIDFMVAEANTREKFSVYDELKKLLIERNIPENEIFFIHDYKTRKQKDLLYTAVNKGEKRIGFGSTKKLGTGVNVQERLVALHHMDIAWRPSDMEQRNGRGERQGNWAAKTFLDNSIPIMYYATERTLDASMYNTVAIKAKFIAQMKTTDNSAVRSIKDVVEDVDMGGMAAELSGDPIFKEKATLEKRLRELEQANRAFTHSNYSIKEKIRKGELLATDLTKRIDGIEKSLPLLELLPKDEKGELILKGVVKSINCTKLTEFGTAILTEAEIAKKHQMIGKRFELGSLWNFKVIGEVDGSGGDKSITRQIVSPNGVVITPSRELATGALAIALQIRQNILEMPSELKRLKESLESTLTNTEEYKRQSLIENPYSKELNEKSERLDIVKTEIIERNKKDTIDEKKKEDLGENTTLDINGFNAMLCKKPLNTDELDTGKKQKL